MNDKPRLFGATRRQLGRVAADLSLPAYAADQLAGWLYSRHVSDFSQMTNLSKDARTRLSAAYDLGISDPVDVRVSADGTKKYLFEAGGMYVETAYIPEDDRATLCVSTQIGCKRSCRFCATGRQGFHGDLDAGGILNQLRSLPERETVTNVVFMGMGEPLDNLDGVLAAVEILCAEWGYALSAGRVTVSTVGILPALDRFLSATRCRVAVSLHSPFSEERARLMPVERANPLVEVLRVIREADIPRSRRISFEYVLLDRINDTERHAKELVRILNGIRCRVNLIPFNGAFAEGISASPRETVLRFQHVLKSKGLTATIRRSRGADINAACGLLSTAGMGSTPR